MDIVLRKIFRVKNSSSNPLSVRNLCKAEIKSKIKPLDIIRVQHFIIPFERNMRKNEQEGVNCPIEYPKKKKEQTFELLSRQTFFLFRHLDPKHVEKLPFEGYSNYPIGRLNTQQNLQITPTRQTFSCFVTSTSGRNVTVQKPSFTPRTSLKLPEPVTK